MAQMWTRQARALGVATALSLAFVGARAQEPAAGEDFFERRIRPVLVEHCYRCHAAGAEALKGGLYLDRPSGLLEGGDSGPSVVPGQPDDSLLIQALRYDHGLEMPPDGRLSDSVIADFVAWVAAGAPDPRPDPSASAGEAPAPSASDVGTHWAFQPRRSRAELFDRVAATAASPLDGLMAASHRAAGLSANPLAAPAVRLRRLYFDVIGLPPPEAVVRRFLADPSPQAYADAVERLLQDPGFGERWGRRWLDLARYADTNGADENMAHPHAWRYRDYVIESFNADKPYDQFLKEQLAGDLLPDPRDEARLSAQWIATGFLALGPKMLAEQDKEKMVYDIVDEQLSVVSRTFLGLSMECARCHDHKFDPITQEDYTALAGVFYSTKTMAHTNHVSRWVERALPTRANARARAAHEAAVGEARARVATLESDVKACEPDAPSEALSAARVALATLENEGASLDWAMGVTEGTATNLPVFVRGNHLNPGRVPVTRGTPATLADIVPVAEAPVGRSGRLALAEWMVDPRHPLTARVLANRIWQGYFGRGLVETPSDFGWRGRASALPEVLDWLASTLIDSGWSMKAVHREILLSQAYQRSSATGGPSQTLDPGNRFFWRQERRRLEAEPIRDALLYVSNGLATRRSERVPQDLAAANDYYRNDPRRFEASVRAVYLPVVRAASYEMMATFDYTQPAAHAGTRASTIVPHQALFMMNSPLVDAASQRLGAWMAEVADAGESVVERLFYRLYGRAPRRSEQRLVDAFLETTPVAAPEDRWNALARAALARSEFIYVD